MQLFVLHAPVCWAKGQHSRTVHTWWTNWGWGPSLTMKIVCFSCVRWLCMQRPEVPGVLVHLSLPYSAGLTTRKLQCPSVSLQLSDRVTAVHVQEHRQFASQVLRSEGSSCFHRVCLSAHHSRITPYSVLFFFWDSISLYNSTTCYEDQVSLKLFLTFSTHPKEKFTQHSECNRTLACLTTRGQVWNSAFVSWCQVWQGQTRFSESYTEGKRQACLVPPSLRVPVFLLWLLQFYIHTKTSSHTSLHSEPK